MQIEFQYNQFYLLLIIKTQFRNEFSLEMFVTLIHYVCIASNKVQSSKSESVIKICQFSD